MPTSDSRRAEDLLASITDEMLGDSAQLPSDERIRVERILLDCVRPDPVQPRRVLPEVIHIAFHNNRLTPTQALRALVQQVQVAARRRGRPFNSVIELLPRADNDAQEETSTSFSPEELLLRDLVNLAMTIREDGQVNPLTVVNVSQGQHDCFALRRVSDAIGQVGYFAISFPTMPAMGCFLASSFLNSGHQSSASHERIWHGLD